MRPSRPAGSTRRRRTDHEPIRHELEPAPYDVLVYLLEGRIDFIDHDCGIETIRAGDRFIMPLDCTCTWVARERVREPSVGLRAEANRD